MAIEFRCTSCGKLLRTADGTSGKQAKCPECGALMTIPAATAPAGAPPPTPIGDNPFGPAGPQSPFGADSGNPYQSPSPFSPIGTAQPSGPIRATKLDLGDAFRRTWAIFKPNWGICLAVLIIVFAINFGVQMVCGFVPIVGALLAMAFQIWINIGQTLFFLKKARGQNVEIGEVFQGWPYFWTVLLASLLVGLMVFGIAIVCVGLPVVVGLIISREATIVLAIIGGIIAFVAIIYLMLVLSQFNFLIIDRRAGVIESLKMSKELMEGNKTTLFLIGFLCGLISLVAAIPCGLGLLGALPFVNLMYPVVYLIITGQPTADRLRVPSVEYQFGAAPTA
jgi:phage FluMu protein Com